MDELETIIRNNGVLLIWDTEDGWCYCWQAVAEDNHNVRGPFDSFEEMLREVKP